MQGDCYRLRVGCLRAKSPTKHLLTSCLCTWIIFCPVTTVRLTAAGVPRIAATGRIHCHVCRSMFTLLVVSQLVLSSDAAALKLFWTKSCFFPPCSPPPPPFSLIRCLFVRCVFCELVFIIAVVYGEGSVNRTKHTLHIFPVLENACSGSVLVINVVNSSTVILLKCHTVGVVHVGVPKDYIYLILLCLSYVGNILSHHGILAQLKPILNIVTVHFNIILLCLVSGSKCSRNARSLLFGGISFHYRSRCQLSC